MRFLFRNILLLAFIFLVSCNKDDSNDNDDMDNAELIVGDWQLYKRFLYPEEGDESVIELELEPCDVFRTFTFNDDFTYLSIRRSGDNCETNNERTGEYEFIDDNTIILDGSRFSHYTIIGNILDASYQESFISEEFIKL